MTDEKSKDNSDTKADHARSERLEWIVAALSAVVVVILAGTILFEAVTARGKTPDISLTPGQSYAMASGYGIDVTVRNTGDVTVADVQIEGRLGDLGETSSVTIDYLPASSSVEIGLGFEDEPDPERLALRVLGYHYP